MIGQALKDSRPATHARLVKSGSLGQYVEMRAKAAEQQHQHAMEWIPEEEFRKRNQMQRESSVFGPMQWATQRESAIVESALAQALEFLPDETTSPP